jgi:uncharacterized protein (DUF1778 family)
MEAFTPNIYNTDTKESRLNIRATQYQKEVIMEAARRQHTSTSNFIVETAYKEAKEILADETNFKLSTEKWAAFCSALDRKPRNISALQQLLSESNIFDK